VGVLTRMSTSLATAVIPTPSFDTLYGLFPDDDGVPFAEPIVADDMPEPYRSLLVHTHHMTVTVEQFYGDRVNVQVLESRHDGDEYARKILLSLAGTGRVVQFGIVQLDLTRLAPHVRDEIVAERTPLGRVLIQNEVLRRVRPIRFVKVRPNAAMRTWFELENENPLYGRLGIIDTDGQPAVEVLEILAPVDIDRQEMRKD
jgi:chorismate-pyruvate lyase